jgi:hypothetical protein
MIRGFLYQEYTLLKMPRDCGDLIVLMVNGTNGWL